MFLRMRPPTIARARSARSCLRACQLQRKLIEKLGEALPSRSYRAGAAFRTGSDKCAFGEGVTRKVVVTPYAPREWVQSVH